MRDTHFRFPYARFDTMAEIEVEVLPYINAGQNSGDGGARVEIRFNSHFPGIND